MSTERTALLIVRVWFEAESPTPLRVQVRQTMDVTEGFEGAFALAEPDAVVEAVRVWLERVQALAEA